MKGRKLAKYFSFLIIGGSLIIAGLFLRRSVTNPPKLSSDFLCPPKASLYEFNYSSGGSTSGPLMAQTGLGRGHSSFHGRGTLLLRCQGGYSSLAEFKSFSYEANGIFAQTTDFVGKPFVIHRHKDGALRSLSFKYGESKSARHVIRDMIGHSSVRIISQDHSWQTEEEDIRGKYQASYNFEESHLTKNRILYGKKNDSHIKSDHTKEIILDDGTTKFAIDQKGLKSLSSKVAVRYKLQGAQIAQSYSSLNLQRAKATALFSLKIDHPASKKTAKTMKLSSKEEEERLQRLLEENALGQDSLTSIMTMLDEAENDHLTPVFLKLKALLKLKPSVANHLKDYLLEHDASSKKFHLISNVLSHVGTPEAQKALVSALKEHKDFKSQMAIIGDIGVSETPTSESDQAIRDFRDQTDNKDIKQTANLALGNMARSVTDKDPTRYEKTLKESMAALMTCSIFEDCVNALHVLGNMGAPETLDVAKRFLYSKDAAIRTIAISSLRFVDLNIVEDILLEKTIKDPDAEVRKAAAHELSFRHLSQKTAQALLDQLTKEKSEGVRIKILVAVSDLVRTHDEWIEKVKLLSVTDMSPSVRDMAHSLTL